MKTLKILAAIVASLPLLASAGPPAKDPVSPAIEVRRAITYNYVEGGYTGVIPNAGSSAHGGYLDLSYSPMDHCFVFGSTGLRGGNDTVVDVAAGLGFYVPVFSSNKVPTVDFVVRAGWNFTSVKGGENTNGWFAAPGFRALLSDSLEINAQGYYYRNDDGNDGIAVGAGIVYYLNTHFGLTANYAYDFDDESHFVQSGIRYMW